MTPDLTGNLGQPAEPTAPVTEGLAVDLYGVKAKITPASGGERPSTWREVWVRAERHLMSIAVDAPGLIADVFRALRGTISSIAPAARGIAQLPAAVVRRISRGRALADSREDQRQAEASSSAPALPPPDEAAQRLLAFLEELRARGLEASVGCARDGKYTFVMTRPELAETAAGLAHEVMREATQSSHRDGAVDQLQASATIPPKELAPPAGGEDPAPPREIGSLQNPKELAKLTARERSVLDLLVLGQTNKRIALTLRLKHKTVEAYVRRIRERFGVRSRAELMARWVRD